MPNTVSIEITNCTQCPHHKVVADPDIDDWFCDDDVAVRCSLSSKTPQRWGNGINYRIGDPMVTVGCRPYNIEKECTPIPDWCPLKASKDATDKGEI